MLFPSIIYGPIRSRRLGISLGVNLMPTNAKICTFDCVYCECGWNQPVLHPELPTLLQVKLSLEHQLSTMQTAGEAMPDVITFSGNGEPTLHPDFLGVIQDTCALRDQYCPKAKVSVLSNSTQLMRDDVVEALWLCDNRILKLDSAINHTMHLIDRPINKDLTVDKLIDRLSVFDGDFTLQTCFLRGEYKGEIIDNTTPEQLDAWYKAVERLHPKQVMIYVIDRTTPLQTLSKIPADQMHQIAQPLRDKGIEVIVSA
jgi:wyosine [tRNA(Phe)-imidazoG37] synthetase (radical SAM superfamily)